jgi:hypothetical protein
MGTNSHVMVRVTVRVKVRATVRVKVRFMVRVIVRFMVRIIVRVKRFTTESKCSMYKSLETKGQ